MWTSWHRIWTNTDIACNRSEIKTQICVTTHSLLLQHLQHRLVNKCINCRIISFLNECNIHVILNIHEINFNFLNNKLKNIPIRCRCNIYLSKTISCWQWAAYAMVLACWHLTEDKAATYRIKSALVTPFPAWPELRNWPVLWSW